MTPEIQTALTTLLLGALAYAGKLGKAYYDMKVKEFELRRVDNDDHVLQYALVDSARNAAAMVERTYVKACKANKTWDENAKTAARSRAVLVAEQLLSTRAKQIAKERNINITDMLTVYIESTSTD